MGDGGAQSGSFDYGERQEDGQYENYPTVDKGEFQQPVRRTYVHEECGGTTSMSQDLAESFARDPGYYDGTFCASCGGHYPLEEFVWKETGETMAAEEGPTDG